MLKTGVYLIKNKITNQFYVGSTSSSFKKRWSLHKYLLNKNQHHSKYLQRSWNKYGFNSFEFIILEECNKSDCLKREQYFIDTLCPKYNSLKTTIYSYKSIESKNTEDHIKYMRSCITENGRKKSIEALVEYSQSIKNKPLSKERIEQIREISKKRRKKIKAFNIKTKEILLFDGLIEASNFFKCSKQIISRTLTKKRNHHKGWIFDYA